MTGGIWFFKVESNEGGARGGREVHPRQHLVYTLRGVEKGGGEEKGKRFEAAKGICWAHLLGVELKAMKHASMLGRRGMGWGFVAGSGQEAGKWKGGYKGGRGGGGGGDIVVIALQ